MAKRTGKADPLDCQARCEHGFKCQSDHVEPVFGQRCNTDSHYAHTGEFSNMGVAHWWYTGKEKKRGEHISVGHSKIEAGDIEKELDRLDAAIYGSERKQAILYLDLKNGDNILRVRDKNTLKRLTDIVRNTEAHKLEIGNLRKKHPAVSP